MPTNKRRRHANPSASETGRDWSHLLPDLLAKIAACLPKLSERAQFHAVCSAWRSVPLPTNLPWLLDTLGRHSCDTSIEARSLLTFSGSAGARVREVHFPGFTSKSIFGSSHGWILAVDKTVFPSASLLNPLTGAQIHLPPLPFRYCIVTHARIISGWDSVVMVYSRHRCGLAFCRPGDRRWREICRFKPSHVRGFTYYKGRFYVIGSNARTVIIDAVTLSKISEIPPPPSKPGHHFLVESSSGELLLLVVRHDWGMERDLFEVFQLEQRKQLRWLRVRSIGDSMLFVDNCHALSLAAARFDGFRGSCIYFMRVDDKGVYQPCLFDMRDGSVKILTLPGDGFPSSERLSFTWLVPSLC